MSKKNTVTFDEAVAPLDDEKRILVADLHSRAISIGYIPDIAKAGSKANNYKLEYRSDKAENPLFISRISNEKLSLGCKLLHLGKYTELLDNLNETIRRELLASRPCKVESGCTAFIQFSFEKKEYLTCRHALRLKTPTASDAQSLWALLAKEAYYRAKQ